MRNYILKNRHLDHDLGHGSPVTDRPPRKRAGIRRAVSACLALVAVFWTAMPLDRALLGADAEVAPVDLTRLEARLGLLEDGLDRVSNLYEQEVQPIENVLRFYSEDDTLVRKVAVALVREGENVGVDPRLLTSVLLVENPWINPTAESNVGAVGLMQVMPFHAGEWGCEGTDLTDLDVNICHGAKVFENSMRLAKGNLDRALLRYNGCVKGTNTPDCHLYPSKVYAAAGKSLIRARSTAGDF
ncbi:MAG: transglycosylase SLT domain-containing protein [Longimicrobiales bacterium]